jgi:hypothetical protein
MKTLLRKPIGILLSVLGLSVFPGATIPASAQYTRYNDPHYILGTPDLTLGLPGEQLVRAAVADLYSYNFNPAIPLLERGVQLGNSDAMYYLSKCYSYGYGVPRDNARSLQLMRMCYRIATARGQRVAKEEQEERERSARAATRAAENAESRSESQSSTYRSTPSKPYKPEPMWVATPWGPRLNAPFTSGGLWYHLNNP